MKNAALIEDGTTLKETGFGNKVYSKFGLIASTPHAHLMGPSRHFNFPTPQQPSGEPEPAVFADSRVVQAKDVKILKNDFRDFSAYNMQQIQNSKREANFLDLLCTKTDEQAGEVIK
jgi:hypothetical protein